MEIIFIRHTSVAVPRGTCYGWTDVPVADTFEEEAARVKQALEAYAPFDCVYSSPLSRARLLADYCINTQPPSPITHHPTPIHLDSRLKEMHMGQWEMQRYDEIDDPHLQAWFDDYMHLPTTGGESFPQFYARVASFLDELRTKPYRRVAVFAHGGVLVCAAIYAGLFPADEHAFEHQVPYGGMLQVRALP